MPRTNLDTARSIYSPALRRGLLGLAALLAATLPCVAGGGGGGRAVAASETGEVRIPLEAWQQLVAQSQQGPPAGWALGDAQVRVDTELHEGRVTGTARASLTVRILGDGWTLVPLLPPGTAVTEARVDGEPVPLVAAPDGLSWGTRGSGKHAVELVWRVEAVSHRTGWSLALPLPRAPSTALALWLPASAGDVAVIPAVGVERSLQGDRTRVTATIPAAAGAQISWRRPERRGLVVGRADYAGSLEEDVVEWTALFQVQAHEPGEALLPLLPSSITLSGIEVDGTEAVAVLDNGRFAVRIEGAGSHTVRASFQVPVQGGEGPPSVRLQIPEVPISRFELTLPGRKEVTVAPRTGVQTSIEGETTIAVAHVPLTGVVAFEWTEAVPEDVIREVQANASVIHLAWAEEGVLYVRAVADWEITRGETNRFRLAVPGGVQIHRIDASAGSIQDWRMIEEDGRDVLEVYLDRTISGSFSFQVDYERLLGADPQAAERIGLPLLEALSVHRQRGMVALLSGQDLVLHPIEEEGASKVGENQLPPGIRQSVTRTVAHTYKYFQDMPRLVVRAAPPERRAGKFDASVDTLISLGEVALRGSSSVMVRVKSGAIMDLALRLPDGVSLLSLTAPSLRTHTVAQDAGEQVVTVSFTREMEDQFRIDLQYERILAEGESGDEAEVPIPELRVDGAEVEHGRIAVEALTAVEVRTARAQHLSAVDVNELPRQLVLKTTNPILLAWKYVHATPPWELVLRTTRHRELEVQEALVERAHYRTLVTRDGLAVTRAEWLVRNSRRQFLRVDLPEGAEVWSAFVAGKAEKPAAASDTDQGVLVRLINSTEGFAVEMVYATPVSEIGTFGRLHLGLARPDMVVTHTRWDLWVPGNVRWREPDTGMEIVVGGRATGGGEMAATADALRGAETNEPLRVTVPAHGVHFAFQKLYAGSAGEAARVTIAYAATPDWLPSALDLLAALLLWTVPALVIFGDMRPPRWLGVLGLLAALGVVYLSASEGGGILFLALSLGAIVVLALGLWVRARRRRRGAG